MAKNWHVQRRLFIKKKEVQLYIAINSHIIFESKDKVKNDCELVGGTHQELEEHCSQPLGNLMGTHVENNKKIQHPPTLPQKKKKKKTLGPIHEFLIYHCSNFVWFPMLINVSNNMMLQQKCVFAHTPHYQLVRDTIPSNIFGKAPSMVIKPLMKDNMYNNLGH